MTIQTLIYIHNLLKEKEEETNATYKAARKLQYEYEANDADKELIESQTVAADEYRKIHNDALTALNEFEGKEWN